MRNHPKYAAIILLLINVMILFAIDDQRVIAISDITQTKITNSPWLAQITSCTNDASFVADITILPNTLLDSGELFTKTWRIHNTGTCTWNNSYQLVYVSGERMEGQLRQNLTSRIEAGSQYNLSVKFTVPTIPGTYRGAWQMSTKDGQQFGEEFWVQIVVPVTPAYTILPSEIPWVPVSWGPQVYEIKLHPGILALVAVMFFIVFSFIMWWYPNVVCMQKQVVFILAATWGLWALIEWGSQSFGPIANVTDALLLRISVLSLLLMPFVLIITIVGIVLLLCKK